MLIVLFFGVQRKEPKEIHPVFVGSKSKVSLRREPSNIFCFPFLTQLDLTLPTS